MSFYDENPHALKDTKVVLRDSLGALAVQILAAQGKLNTSDYQQTLCDLHAIIADLHKAYEDANGNF